VIFFTLTVEYYFLRWKVEKLAQETLKFYENSEYYLEDLTARRMFQKLKSGEILVGGAIPPRIFVIHCSEIKNATGFRLMLQNTKLCKIKCGLGGLVDEVDNQKKECPLTVRRMAVCLCQEST
jgi:hypothetical protein